MSKRKYCCYDKSNDHDTNNDKALNDDIDELIQKDKLKKYVSTNKDGEQKCSSSPCKGKGIASEVDNVSKPVNSKFTSEEDKQKSKARPVALVVFGRIPRSRRGEHQNNEEEV